MMTVDSSPEQIETGIACLSEGRSFAFEGVVFFVDRAAPSKRLNIDSYSNFIHLDNVTQDEAKEKIERSKKVGLHLAESFPAFSEIWATLPHKYGFCYDYGTGAVLVASEIDGDFTWLKK